jgi:hypothetical protein
VAVKALPKPVIHHYQHTDSGAVHGFTHPLPTEIAKQVKAGILVLVADEDGTDPAAELIRLRAQVDAMAKASGIDPSSFELDGLADTSGSSDEAGDPGDGDAAPSPDDEDGDDDETAHLCLECGDPVERKGKTGPWPQRHPGCK